ncbi:hypothetical protein M153_4170004142 [Pseudoloma neurophilia]|uniref:Post-GPI attachment to proteins factor 3 n=1 Tax=Pseudoloma neurophilia TaxID=146866 RepID=A0A0R0M3H3_9MICR|nr:hypothetical protein M153_4170004142 [Pseudoloma neurophilia]
MLKFVNLLIFIFFTLAKSEILLKKHTGQVKRTQNDLDGEINSLITTLIMRKNRKFKFTKCSKICQLYFLLRFDQNMKNSNDVVLNLPDRIIFRNLKQKKEEISFHYTIDQLLSDFSLSQIMKYHILSIKYQGRQAHRQIYGVLEVFSSLFSFFGFIICLIGHYRLLKKKQILSQKSPTGHFCDCFYLFFDNLDVQSVINIISTLISTIYHMNPHNFYLIFSDYMGVFAICYYCTWFNWWKINLINQKIIQLSNQNNQATEKNEVKFLSASQIDEPSIISRKTTKKDSSIISKPVEPVQLIVRNAVLIPYAIVFFTQFFFFSKNFMKIFDLVLIFMSHYYEFSIPSILRSRRSTLKNNSFSKIMNSFDSLLLNLTRLGSSSNETNLESSICSDGISCKHRTNLGQKCPKLDLYVQKVSRLQDFLRYKMYTIISCILIEYLDFPPIYFLFDSHALWHLLLIFQTTFHYKIEEIQMEIFYML